MKTLKGSRQEFLHDYAQVCSGKCVRIEYPVSNPRAFEAESLEDAKDWARRLLNACGTLERVTIWHRDPEAYVDRDNWCFGRKWMATITR